MGSNTLESRDAEENAQQFEKKKTKTKTKTNNVTTSRAITRTHAIIVEFLRVLDAKKKVVEILFSDSLSFIIL